MQVAIVMPAGCSADFHERAQVKALVAQFLAEHGREPPLSMPPPARSAAAARPPVAAQPQHSGFARAGPHRLTDMRAPPEAEEVIP